MESLRHAVMAAAVLDEAAVTIDLTAGDALDDPAVVVGASSGGTIRLTWTDVATAIGGADTGSGWARVAALIDAAATLADGGPPALAARLRAHAALSGCSAHPGPAWVVERLLGGALDAGWGLVPAGQRLTVPLPPSPTLAAAMDGAWPAWGAARAEVGRLAAALVERLERDRRERRAIVVRRMAHCDVATLLLAPGLRRWISRLDGTGLGVLAMPTRSTAWTDVRLVDPAFVATAYAATGEMERGVPRLLLVTQDEVVLPRGVAQVAAEPAPQFVIDLRREP